MRTPGERSSPFSPPPGPNYEPPLKLPHMSHLTFPETLLPRQDCSSPLPRRKQARPRRRSGEMCGPQDLTKPSSPAVEETAENLCMKKPSQTQQQQQQQPAHQQHAHHQQHHQMLQKEATKPQEVARLKVMSPDRCSPELDLSMPDKEYAPSPPLSLPPALGMVHDTMDSHSPLPFPPMPSVSALAMTPPHSKCKWNRIFFLFQAFTIRARLKIGATS